PTHRVGQHEGRVLLPQLQAALDRADGAREVGAREIVIAPVLGAAGGSGGFALAVQLADGDDPAAGGELLGDRLVIAGADAEARSSGPRSPTGVGVRRGPAGWLRPAICTRPPWRCPPRRKLRYFRSPVT